MDEVPPEEKPEGDNIQWTPGYWAWDEERTDFLWVSGFWRVPPPDCTWMPGYWAWGDDDYRSLFVTASTSLYRLRVAVAGLPVF